MLRDKTKLSSSGIFHGQSITERQLATELLSPHGNRVGRCNHWLSLLGPSDFHSAGIGHLYCISARSAGQLHRTAANWPSAGRASGRDGRHARRRQRRLDGDARICVAGQGSSELQGKHPAEDPWNSRRCAKLPFQIARPDFRRYHCRRRAVEAEVGERANQFAGRRTECGRGAAVAAGGGRADSLSVAGKDPVVP